jgi:hypothetical protein
VGRLDPEGSLHYHVILFLIFLFLFITLKNVDFSDFRASPILTDMQVLFVELLFIVLVFLVTLISFRGYLIKTPDYATRGLFALVIVSLGLFVIAFNLLWDPVVMNGQDFEIGGLGTVSMAISAILIASGMVVYISIKFSEDRQQQWFVEAVKDTMHRMEVSEHRPYNRMQAARARSKVRARPQPKPVYNEPLPAPSNTPMLPPSTEPTQQAPSVQHPASPQAAAAPVPQPVSPKIIKCPQCAVPLKVPDVPQRPLNIRCPHCGAIGTVND